MPDEPIARGPSPAERAKIEREARRQTPGFIAKRIDRLVRRIAALEAAQGMRSEADDDGE